MAVRAVIARSRGNEFEGVYLHNGGEPSELGPVLWNLMRVRYGFDAARFSREMIDQNLAGWSSIDVLGGELAKTWDGRTKVTVEQHQDNFNRDVDDPGPTSFEGDPQRQIAGLTAPPCVPGNTWGADLVYVMASDAMHVLVAEGESGPYTTIATLPWGAEPDWDDVDDALAAAAGESPQSEAVVATSFEHVKRGDLAGAQRALLDYLAQGGAKTSAVLTNLFYTLREVAPPKMTAIIDDTVATIMAKPRVLTPELLDNLCIVLNNAGRGAQSLQLGEHAMSLGIEMTANCYVGMTFGAYTTLDPVLMRRAVEHIDTVMRVDPDLLVENPAVFDNTAALYLALGDKAKTLEYVKLCKTHNYEHFAAMPKMPDYAAIKNDKEFKKLFK